MNRSASRLTLLLSLAFTVSAHAQTLQSTFDTGLEGWTGSFGSVTYSAANGNPGGFLQQADLDLNDMFVSAPPAFLGNLLGFAGGTLSFDARQIVGTADYAPFGIVSLRSGASVIFADIVPLNNPTSNWATFSVTLNAASFGTDAANFAAILGNLTAIDVSLESQVGVIETVGFDNFRMVAAVPEPAGLFAIAGATLGSLAVWYRQRRAPSRRRRN